MEIEIVTTKKKITKSIINQMEIGSFNYLDMLASGKLMGKLVNVRKGVETVYLVEFGFGYRLIADTFYKQDFCVRDKPSFGSVKEFKSQKECDEFYQIIKNLRRKCVQIFI